MTANFSFVFFALIPFTVNLDPGQLASFFHVRQIGIIAKELQKREVIF